MVIQFEVIELAGVDFPVENLDCCDVDNCDLGGDNCEADCGSDSDEYDD